MFNLTHLALVKATWETVYMVFISSFFSILFGLALGAILFITGKNQQNKNSFIHRTLGLIVNVTRSVPFIILMISVIPLTRILVGTTIGINAAIIPLTIAAIPFFARVCENALAEVPSGLLEAANAMGASTWQTVSKVLIPESLPSLIRGATLTIIGLIGYSAMAGVVGGGGLGELAINYGYQRFDAVVMIETVLILIVMVQAIQMLGEFLAKRRKVHFIFALSLLLWMSCIAYQVWPVATAEDNTLKIGVMNGLPEKVMEVAKEEAKEKYHLHLQIVTFTDYVQPNTALDNGSIDANIFQHTPYLEAQVKAHHLQIMPIAKTFVYPMGFYSKKIEQLSQLKEGSLIAIPNDPSNGGRALLVLQKFGLIQLKPEAGTLATLQDITQNPKHLKFKLLDAAQLPRVLNDADLVAITNDFVGPSGLTIQDAIIKEGSDSPYANLIVVKIKDKDKSNLQDFIKTMHSKAVVKKTQEIFPNGAAIPAWKE